MRGSKTKKPTQEELDLVNVVLDRARHEDWRQVMAVVADAACRWQDTKMWVRVVNASGVNVSIVRFSTDGAIERALAAFGLPDNVRSW